MVKPKLYIDELREHQLEVAEKLDMVGQFQDVGQMYAPWYRTVEKYNIFLEDAKGNDQRR